MLENPPEKSKLQHTSNNNINNNNFYLQRFHALTTNGYSAEARSLIFNQICDENNSNNSSPPPPFFLEKSIFDSGALQRLFLEPDDDEIEITMNGGETENSDVQPKSTTRDVIRDSIFYEIDRIFSDFELDNDDVW